MRIVHEDIQSENWVILVKDLNRGGDRWFLTAILSLSLVDVILTYIFSYSYECRPYTI